MSLNESIVEDAALEWFLLRYTALNYGGQVGEQFCVAPTLIPAFSQREKGKEREASCQLRTATFSRTLDTLLPKLLRGELAWRRLRQPCNTVN